MSKTGQRLADRFVDRWRTGVGTRRFVMMNDLDERIAERLVVEATGRPHLYSAHDGWWDREMNDIVDTFEEVRRREGEPVPDRFARLQATETKPSTAKEGPRENEEERKR